MTQQPETQSDVLSGPLTPGVERLRAGGWTSVQVPGTRVVARQPVVLVGTGGVLVIGTHKTADAALAELGARVTALVPQRLRSIVLIENGHDRQSLPALAESLPPALDGADVHAALDALAGLGTDDGLLTVQEFLARTKDAARNAADELRTSRAVRLANFVGRNAVAIALLVSLLFLSAAISTGTGSARDSVAHTSTSQQADGSSATATDGDSAASSSERAEQSSPLSSTLGTHR